MRTSLLAALLGCSIGLHAADKATLKSYYSSIDGLQKEGLKTALFKLLQQNHTTLSYAQLWEVYKDADVRSDGYLYDIYSSATRYRPGTDQSTGSYAREGDSYNREHTVPKSWFDDASPMYTDAHHVLPTDAYVNGRRSNLPLGEVATSSYESQNGYSKVGNSALSGYSGKVFEPNDEYKGDLARIYFYMATRYENAINNWSAGNGNAVFCNGTYPGLQQWTLDMFKRWAKADAVSEKERSRNDAIYSRWQHNRNPFVDFPQLVDYIWGDSVDYVFHLDAAIDHAFDDYTLQTPTATFSATTATATLGSSFTPPTFTTSSTGAVAYSSSNTAVATVDAATGELTLLSAGTTTITALVAQSGNYRAASASYELTVTAGGGGSDSGGGSDGGATSDGLYTLCTSSADLRVGSSYIIAYPEDSKVLGPQAKNNCRATDATFTEDLTAITAISSDAREFTLGGSADAYTLSDAEGYIGASSSSSNWLRSTSEAEANQTATISFEGTNAIIVFNGDYKRNTVRFNPNNGSPLFSCYAATSTQKAVSLYRKTSTTAISTTATPARPADNAIYTLQGVRVERPQGKGIYIIGGRKVVVR